MAETLGGNDHVPSRPAPTAAGADDARPGYPPPGQSEALAAVAAAEAAERPADADAMLDGELAALDASVESPEVREARLGEFIRDHFSDVVPAEYLSPAIDVCCEYEDQIRDLFGEPDFVIAQEDAEDPSLVQRIEDTVEVAANDETITALADDRDELQATVERQETEVQPANAAAIDRQVAANQGEQIGLERDETVRSHEFQSEAEIAEDLDTIEGVQARFAELKADHGTIGALELLLEGEDALQNPEMRGIVQRAISTARSLVRAIPGKEAAIGRLLDQSGLNLAAGSQIDMFAGLLSAAEASDEFTEEDVEQLRTVLAGSDEAIRTGTDFEDAMNERVLDEEGNEIPAHTAGEPLEFGVGLEGFTSDDGAQQFMRATPEHGQGVTLEVTHLSPEEKAVLASYLDTWRMTEDAGASEWLLSLTQYDLHGQNIVDPIQLIEAAQVVNAVYGGLAGYNGEVLRGPEQVGMIQWQAQLASPKGDAARSDRNPTMTASAMMGLGIQDENGNLDLDVLRAFGEYSRENWFSAPDYEAVQAHLQARFPEKFERPNAPA